MYRFWLEQALPPEFAYLIGDEAIVVGCARTNPESPLRGLEQAQEVIAGPALRYDGAFLARAPQLRVLSRTGIGVDNISIPDATERGIVVCNAPDAPTASTAELTLALMLAAVKRLRQGERDLARGEPKDYFNSYRGIELEGLWLGIVGVGRIGTRVARAAQALGMRVIGYSRSLTADKAAALGIEAAPDLETLLSRVDIVSLHLPAVPATRQLLNARTLALMKPGAYLINTARGALVDEAALRAALERGHLAGAGLDVFESEPPLPHHPLLNREDVIVSPHVGGATAASRRRLWGDAIRQALQVLRGERPATVLNPEVYSRREP